MFCGIVSDSLSLWCVCVFACVHCCEWSHLIKRRTTETTDPVSWAKIFETDKTVLHNLEYKITSTKLCVLLNSFAIRLLNYISTTHILHYDKRIMQYFSMVLYT